MSNKTEKPCRCSDDKRVWIGSIIISAIIIFTALWQFEQLPELPRYDHYEWLEIYFWLWYGLLGGVIIGLASIFGVLTMYAFCKEKDDTYVISLILFLILGITIILMVSNAEDSWQETERPDYYFEDDDDYSGSDYTYDSDLCHRDSWCSIEEYIEHDLEYHSDSRADSKYTSAFAYIDNLVTEKDCDNLIQWRLGNYAQMARHYGSYKINELGCLENEE